ncbi:MAG: hypothetical protein LBB20_03445 [Puniceicoccales bacterium]|jgi:hypothetical protein|nr:hypothetical protein [Puniceicoccales bacterium]
MKLIYAELLVGLLLIVSGILLIFMTFSCEKNCKAFIRSNMANWLVFGSAVSWFLWHITRLGEPDFGQYKWIFFGFFLTIAVIAFMSVRDFLCVRGLAVLVLLISNELLKAAYMCEQKSKLLMVSFLYLAITTAIYLGIVPYRFRDFIDWLFKNDWLPKFVGLLSFLYGGVILYFIKW